MPTREPVVLSIGHSNHPIDRFIDLLHQHGVTAIADVRSAPYSRFNPQYNKDALDRSLKESGIRYVFLGRELGARSDDPAHYQDGRVQYARLAGSQKFQDGLARVMRGAGDHRIALMCSERDPLDCHRCLLVARALAERGVAVDHILPDGRLEPHEATMTRLLDVVGLPRTDLFRSRQELLTDALARKEGKVAYVDEDTLADKAPS